MTQPEIKDSIGGYEFMWRDQHINIKVSRLHVHTDGRVTGEILVGTDAANYSPILYPPSQLNFSSSRTRNELARHLKDAYPTWDWSEFIDSVSYHIQERARLGEPVQELWTSEDIRPLQYLIEPLISKDVPTVIYGEKGVGKSTLVLALYACLILPWYDNPLGLKAPSESIRTLVLDWEVDGEIVQRTAKQMQMGMDMPPFPIFYRRCSLPLIDDLETIQRHISDIGAEAIIIDSLGQAAGGELKDAESALNFFAALRKLKVTSIINAQTSKDTESKRKHVYGSTFFEYYARSVFELCKSDSDDSDDISVGLFHRMCNLARLDKPRGFRIHYNENGISIEDQPLNPSEFRDKVRGQLLIHQVLQKGALSIKEIVEQTELTEHNIRVILSRLAAKSKVTKLADGKWGLLQPNDV